MTQSKKVKSKRPAQEEGRMDLKNWCTEPDGRPSDVPYRECAKCGAEIFRPDVLHCPTKSCGCWLSKAYIPSRKDIFEAKRKIRRRWTKQQEMKRSRATDVRIPALVGFITRGDLT